jgi:hypothetical protein
MRVFVRHPSEFPIELRASDDPDPTREQMRDLSVGGLCCRSSSPRVEGQRVHVRIAVGSPAFVTEGRVAWCRPHEDSYRIGIEFVGDSAALRLRMVEQVCHIERYHRQQLAEGREVTGEQAAEEWIAQYAARFPR